MDNKEIIRSAFRDIFGSDKVDEAKVALYFSPEYIQHVDGKTINYAQFIKHLHEQRKTLASIKVTFLTIASEGDIVFSNHLITATKHDGAELQGKVIAQFTVKDGKIVGCDELTLMLTGSKKDKDLGSR